MTNLEWLKSLTEKQLIKWLAEEHNEYTREEFIQEIQLTIKSIVETIEEYAFLDLEETVRFKKENNIIENK